MMCDERLFEPQVTALADVADMWVGSITGASSIEAIADGLLETVPFERFALCGLSMGGIVAMQVIERASHRVTRVALLDTNHLAETPERRELRAPQIDRVRRGGLREVLIEEMKPNYLGGAHRDDAALLDRVLAMGLALGPDVFERQSRALRDRPDASDVLRRFRGPALVLCGEEDRLCPPERHRAMADLMPGSTLVVVPGAGHLSTLEAPDIVNGALRTWLLQPSLVAQPRPAAPRVARQETRGVLDT
ncbi:MAG TPA: alpha/beta fold hydrolase [Microvirga sp.]|jgi:pimeloyl-ACP methyl ester carboxylesterase|nr:alpha/beta fold hydrolase [Microvirga sp.]